MIVGEIRNQIDSIWNDFWSGGLSNPLSVMEQITYLLFIKRLDELQTVEERKAAMLKQPLERRIFPEGRDGRGDEEMRKLGGRPYEDLRWSRFKGFRSRRRCSRSSTSMCFRSSAKWWRRGRRRQAYEGGAQRNPDAGAARQGGRQARQGADGGSRHQGRRLRIHARQDRQRRAERPVPHAAPHHQADGRTDRADAKRHRSAIRPAGTCGFLVAAGEFLREKHPEILRDPKTARALSRIPRFTASISIRRCCASAR